MTEAQLIHEAWRTWAWKPVPAGKAIPLTADEQLSLNLRTAEGIATMGYDPRPFMASVKGIDEQAVYDCLPERCRA